MKKHSLLYKNLTLTVLLLAVFCSTRAATYSSAATGNWNVTTSWTPAGVPIAGDVVNILAGHTITVTANAACASVTFTQVTGNLIVNSGITLTISGALIRNAISAVSSSTISGQGTLSCASLNAGSNVSGTNNTTFSQTLNTSISTLNISGNLTIIGYKIGQRYRNGIFNITGGNVTVNGSVTTTNSDASNVSTLSMTGGNLILMNATPFNLSATGINTINLNGATALVNYNRAGDQSVYATTYTNLTLSASGTKTLTATNVDGTLTMDGTATAAGTTPVYGANAALQYAGGSAQTTGIEFPGTFSSTGGVIINKNAGSTVTLNSNRIITSQLSLQSGMVSPGTNTLTLQNSDTPVIRTSGTLTAPLNSTVEFGSAGNTTGAAFSIPSGTFTSGSLHNLSVTRDNPLTLNNDLTINGTLSLSGGEVILGANSVTLQTSNIPVMRTSGTISTTSASSLSFGSAGNTGGNAFTLPSGLFSSNPVPLNNLSVFRTNQLTLGDQMLNISNIVLCNGPLQTNGNLTLLSTAAGTALIDGSGTGTITGNVTMQRYLSTGGYKYFSSPFTNATVNEFSEEVNLAASFPTFYYYDENDATSSGWVTYTDPSGLLIPLYGHAVNFGAVATVTTVNITGTVNSSPVSRSIQNNDYPFTKGFSLVGNPYPSPVNWDAPGWTKTNIDNALYYFRSSGDQYSGTYSSYVNGISSDPGNATGIIPSMQGFFIRVSDGSYPVNGTLAANNSVRVNDLTHSFLKSDKNDTPPLLKLSAAFSDNLSSSDGAVIYFHEKGTSFFDNQIDALKLINTDVQTPNIYTIGADGNNFSIAALPDTGDNFIIIPLGLTIKRTGQVQFRLDLTSNLDPDITIFLHDEATATDRILDSSKGYSINLAEGVYDERFSVRFMRKGKSVPDNWPDQDLLNAYFFRGKLITDIYMLAGTKGRLSVSNLAGNTVFIKDINSLGYHEFDIIRSPGIYILNFTTGGLRVSKKIFIHN